MNTSDSASFLRSLIQTASLGLVDREALVELVILGAVAGEHLLVIGPPGTAKSEAVRRASQALGGRLFEYLLGRFTEPNELFGPVDLRRLREGVVEIETRGMLPEAELAFLDEVFLGSTAILNTLLSVLNERRFRRGSTVMQCPLRVCVGASNALPEEAALAAFADRFLLRAFVQRTADPMLEDLLGQGWKLGQRPEIPEGGMAALTALASRLSSVDLAPVRPAMADIFRKLRGAAISLSDRRMVRSQRLVAAAALLDGREIADQQDLWPIIYVLPTADTQVAGRELLGTMLTNSRNRSLGAAALEASAGPTARADRLVQAAEVLLAVEDQPEGWRLRAEGILREMDAGFVRDRLPESLSEVRGRLVARLGH